MCWGLLSTTLGVTIHLHRPHSGVCPLRVRILLISRLLLWKLAGLFRRSFPSFFFDSAFWTMYPPSSKSITWVFELQIFKLWTLLTKVHTIIDSTFSNSLRSMTSGFNLHSNDLIDIHLGLILWRSSMDLPNLGPFVIQNSSSSPLS